MFQIHIYFRPNHTQKEVNNFLRNNKITDHHGKFLFKCGTSPTLAHCFKYFVDATFYHASYDIDKFTAKAPGYNSSAKFTANELVFTNHCGELQLTTPIEDLCGQTLEYHFKHRPPRGRKREGMEWNTFLGVWRTETRSAIESTPSTAHSSHEWSKTKK